MKILLLGSGGREHAFAYMIAKSPLCSDLFIAPGNPGTEKHGENISIAATDFDTLSDFVMKHEIEMVVVGPEDPLVKGIYDFFGKNPALQHVAVIGPSQAGAQLEGSKDFAKQFMKKYNIPTAKYETFTADQADEAMAYIDQHSTPIVLKADGLAAGKGVVICSGKEEAKKELRGMLSGKFGAAGNKVVIEEFLSGIEMSCFVLTDGIHYRILPTAKDYKRIGEGDTGLNTGGMGAVSPVPFADPDGSGLMKKIEERMVIPSIKGLQNENIIYKGFIYLGLMICYGEPYMIEYNCRMGDPETQAVLPRLKSDLVELLIAVHEGNLDEKKIEVLPYKAATIVLASKGYPENYEKGKLINGLQQTHDCLVFHAGTRKRANGDIETNGGRVLAVTSFSRELKDAQALAIRNAEIIEFEGKYFRRDVGRDVM
ncbi:MAG TPA: phosphoribosylamine--glycine ligase [Chitinophagales bacterium]|nr:phosphoribosylamine--glycine ligase [Chitinophagales bacterium]